MASSASTISTSNPSDNEQESFTIRQLALALNAYENLKEEADAQRKLINWGEEGVCTHDKGYIEQPVYACSTCIEKTGEVFGFCYGCSMDCHLDHNVIELFSKRHFKCDCPTLAAGNCCSLHAAVKERNTMNSYNHNFKGTYCWCKKTYDHNSDVVMIQCYMCQDWFHQNCIEKEDTMDFDEDNDFICKDCVEKYRSFLTKYSELEYRSKEIKIESSTDAKESNSSNGVEDKATVEECKIKNRVLGQVKNLVMASGWREKICKCDRCLKMYKLLGIEFILQKSEDEDEDQSSEEEEMDDQKLEDSIALPQTMQCELAHRYQELKEGLLKFMTKWAAQKRTVTERDIKDFQESLTTRKRPRYE